MGMLKEFQEMVRQRHLKNMQFDRNDIDTVRTIYDTNGNPFPFVKLNTVLNVPNSQVFCGYKTRYIVTDSDQNPFAEIAVVSDDSTALIEYRNEGARRQGIVLSGLLTVENDIFSNRVLDNLPTPDGDSKVSNLKLDIDSSNRASQKLAIKAGFSYDEESEVAIKTFDDYIKQIEITPEEQWQRNIL